MDAEGWGCGDAAGWGRRDVVGWRRGDAAGHEHGVTVVNFTHGKGAGLGRGHQSTVPTPHPCRQKELLHPDVCWECSFTLQEIHVAHPCRLPSPFPFAFFVAFQNPMDPWQQQTPRAAPEHTQPRTAAAMCHAAVLELLFVAFPPIGSSLH